VWGNGVDLQDVYRYGGPRLIFRLGTLCAQAPRPCPCVRTNQGESEGDVFQAG